MPVGAALPWIIGLGTAGSIAGQIYGAKRQSTAAREAAAMQSRAATQAADPPLEPPGIRVRSQGLRVT